MDTKFLAVGLYWVTLLLNWIAFLPVVIDAGSKGEVEVSELRQEFEQFQDQVNKKFESILVGLVKDESLRGPAGAKGEKGERGLPGADSNVGLAILEAMNRMVHHVSPDTPCGGHITVDGPTDVTYRVPETGSPQSCLWIVAAKKTAPLKFRLVELTLHTDFKFVCNPSHNSNCGCEELTIMKPQATTGFEDAIVFFYGHTPGAGFKLKIEDSGSSVSSRKLSFLHKHDSFISAYPASAGTSYGNLETFFILGAPSPGKRVDVNVENIDTENHHDSVSLMWADPKNLTQCERRSGRGVPNINAVVPENASFVIYFQSDSSTVGTGFQANATYI